MEVKKKISDGDDVHHPDSSEVRVRVRVKVMFRVAVRRTFKVIRVVYKLWCRGPECNLKHSVYR